MTLYKTGDLVKEVVSKIVYIDNSPSFTVTTDSITVRVGQTITYTPLTSDLDNDPVTFTFNSNPIPYVSLSLDQKAIIIAPPYSVLATTSGLTVIVDADDGLINAYPPLTLTINVVNESPYLITPINPNPIIALSAG